VPVYVTSEDGVITYFNRACIGFAGRIPRVGRDRWCVSWKLYTEAGQFLPHDQCPMAIAIREKRMVRGSGAIAERPDGTHVSFLPYPTPLFSANETLVGAINIFIAASGGHHMQAPPGNARCRSPQASGTRGRGGRSPSLRATTSNGVALMGCVPSGSGATRPPSFRNGATPGAA
jgi:hypothetical protein